VATRIGASSFHSTEFASRLLSMQDFDDRLSAAIGKATPIPNFWHVYDSDMPTYSTGSGAQARNNGWNLMWNVRLPLGDMRTTGGRNALNALLASLPTTHLDGTTPFFTYLIGWHEPENDTPMGAPEQEAYRLDMAEFVKLVIDFDPDGSHVVPVSVFMGDPPLSWDLFDFTPHLRPGDIDKMVFGFDAYVRARTGPPRVDVPDFKYGDVMAWGVSKGFKRMAICETTVNNEAGIAQSIVDEWFAKTFPAWLEIHPEIEAVAFYDSSGPAAGPNGEGWIDSPGEEHAVANLMVNGVTPMIDVRTVMKMFGRLVFRQQTTPTSPPASHNALYPKADGQLYTQTPDGQESALNSIDPFVFNARGTLTVRTGTTPLYLSAGYRLVDVRIGVAAAPTGQDLVIDVNKNGTTIYGTQANRPKIVAGAASPATALGGAATVTTFAAGDYLTVDIDQIGNGGVPGVDLAVTVRLQRTS
jgi:hypothetical protein